MADLGYCCDMTAPPQDSNANIADQLKTSWGWNLWSGSWLTWAVNVSLLMSAALLLLNTVTGSRVKHLPRTFAVVLYIEIVMNATSSSFWRSTDVAFLQTRCSLNVMWWMMVVIPTSAALTGCVSTGPAGPSSASAGSTSSHSLASWLKSPEMLSELPVNFLHKSCCVNC